MAEWSWGLLTGAEQAVLRRLCAFPDGLTLEAARGVAGGADVPSGEADAVLARLVDRSVLLRDGGGYRVPGVVASYGRERLVEAEEGGGAGETERLGRVREPVPR